MNTSNLRIAGNVFGQIANQGNPVRAAWSSDSGPRGSHSTTAATARRVLSRPLPGWQRTPSARRPAARRRIRESAAGRCPSHESDQCARLIDAEYFGDSLRVPEDVDFMSGAPQFCCDGARFTAVYPGERMRAPGLTNKGNLHSPHSGLDPRD